jgi:hypothetical protein
VPVEFKAYDAVIELLLVILYVEPDIKLAAAAFVAYDAVNANVAYDAVPSKLPVIPPDTPNEPVITVLPDMSRAKFKFGFFLMPVLLDETTSAFDAYDPTTILSSLKTSKIGTPDMSLTLIKLPVSTSEISNKDPDFPPNDTVPSDNTSSTILEETLPEKKIFALFDPVGASVISPERKVPETCNLAREDVVLIPTFVPLSNIMLFPSELVVWNLAI